MDDIKVKKLSDEESAQINGGMVFRTASDSDFLKLIGMMDESFSTAELLFDWESCSAKVDEGWAKLGITCVTNPADFDEYYYLGKKISRTEAYYINLFI